MKIAVVTDSNSGITQSMAKELGVTVVPIIAKKKNGVDKISLAIKNSVNKTVNYDINFGNEVQTYKINSFSSVVP